MTTPEQPVPGTNPPWFSPGLHFTCTQCGNCCTGEPGSVWVDAKEVEAIADFLDVPRGEVQHLKTKVIGDRLSLKEHANGDCIYLDAKTRRCSIYPVRPKQCRTWPFWNSNLESPATWNNVQTKCPGAGQGGFVSLDQIQSQAEIIDI